MIWGFYDMQLKCPSFVCICMRICRNSMLFFACSDPHPVPILFMTQNIRNRRTQSCNNTSVASALLRWEPFVWQVTGRLRAFPATGQPIWTGCG